MWMIRGKVPYHPWHHPALQSRQGVPAGVALRLSQQPGAVAASTNPANRARGIRSATNPADRARGIRAATYSTDRTRGISNANPANRARGI